ncbi:MAG: hypothetical protein OEV50_01530, partial [Candidatus Aminicenantes bacterium]|nr:hypothetical protein [Candidatus Aminicenantes bacterium]
MVESILRVIFDAKDDRFFPEAAFAEGFDDTAKGKVIVGDASGWSGGAGAGSAGVIDGQTDQ